MRLTRSFWIAFLCAGCASSCGGPTTQPSAPNVTTESTASETPTPETPPEQENVAVSPDTNEQPSLEGFATPPPATDAAMPSRAESERFANAANALGFDLYQKVRESDGNLVYSPASLEIAFAMTAAGARGDTATEMNRVLHVGSSPSAFHESAGRVLTAMNQPRQAYELHAVNRLFGEQTYTFEASFLALTRDTYRAPFEPMDFLNQAEPGRQRINAWVMSQTNDKIDELLPADSLNDLTRLVLVNAVYFLGKWQKPFSTPSTQPGFFYANGENRVTAPIMHQTSLFAYGEVDDVQVLEMGYEGDEVAMTILLPRTRDGLGALERSLDAAKLARFVGALSPTQVAVSLPKFRVADARLPLPDLMKELGMRLAFERDRADFSGMGNPANPEEHLFISDAFHEAFIAVNEEGTEAAASTAVVMSARGGVMRPPTTFEADHPFVFLVRDTRTNAVLFLGRLVDPS